MSHPSTPTVAAVDRALALLIADGAQAAGLVDSVLARPDLEPALRALASSVRALIDLREGDPDRGLRALDAAQVAIDDSPLGRRAADLLVHGRALGHRHAGQLAEAEALLRELHDRAAQRPLVDAYLTAGALGIVVSMRGDDDGSLDVFYQALGLARRSGEDSLLVNALNNLGSTQADLHNLEDAAPMLQECLAGALRLGSRRQVIYAAGNLVQCLCLQGQSAAALAVARAHLIGHIQPDDPPSLQRDEEIAQVLLDNDRIDEAEAVLAREAQVDPMSNELATARVWLDARVLLARGRADEALRRCLARQAWLERDGEASTIAIDRVNLLRVAAQAAAAVGDTALAYRLLGQAFTTHEQLLGRAARSRHLSLQISHRLRQAEWERDTAQEMAARLEALNDSLRVQVAETERLQQRLRSQALEDPLTGLHNRRHLMDAGAALLALQRRRGEPLAVAIVDLDHFKQVNDHHGHDAGDRVLQAFADLVRRQTRSADIVCRYGGEEFVLLLPGAGAAQAAARLEAMRQAFRALRFDGASGSSFHADYSAGICVWATHEDAGGPPGSATHGGLPALLARADAALYQAKLHGRGRVELEAAPSAQRVAG